MASSPSNKGFRAMNNPTQLKEFFIVSTPIGNPKDISLRAVEVLRRVEALVVEKLPSTKKLLDALDISIEGKTTWELNRKNEAQVAQELAMDLLRNVPSAALITDGGTPLLDDPGQHLLKHLRPFPSVGVTFLPGACSWLAALVQSGFETTPFTHLGFLPVQPERRQKALGRLRLAGETTTLLENPHRLHQLLSDLRVVFGGEQRIAVCFDLTKPSEQILRGRIDEITEQVRSRKAKQTFVVVVEGSPPKNPLTSEAQARRCETSDQRCSQRSPIRPYTKHSPTATAALKRTTET